MRAKQWWAAAAVFTLAASARADERHTVRPGEGIGDIKLGMNVTQVHDAMAAWGAKSLLTGSKGGPGAWLDAQAGAAIEAYSTDKLGNDRYGNTMKVFYVKNVVAQIAVQSIAYVTPKGGSTRLTSTEFRMVHPSLHPLTLRNSWGGPVRAYDSDRQGLAVTYTVMAGDRESRSAQELIVHAVGSPVLLESPRHAGKAAKPGVESAPTAAPPGDAGE